MEFLPRTEFGMSLANSPRIYSFFQLLATSPRPNRRYQSQSGTFTTARPIRLKVKWIKYKKQGWCRLRTLNLDNVATNGVFIIWKPNNKNNVIRVGQGNIARSLQALRNDPNVSRFGDDLLVTWASIQRKFRDGAERYLYEQYSPAGGERINCASLIYLNLPGKS